MEKEDVVKIIQELLSPINELLSTIKAEFNSRFDLLLNKTEFNDRLAALEISYKDEITKRDSKIQELEETVYNQQVTIEAINVKLCDLNKLNQNR